VKEPPVSPHQFVDDKVFPLKSVAVVKGKLRKNLILERKMSASGKSLLGLWLYRSGEQEWAVKEGSPMHKPTDFIVIINS
jgi:hypothetical protein